VTDENGAHLALSRELLGGLQPDGITATKHQLHGRSLPPSGFLVSVPWLSMAWNGVPEVRQVELWVQRRHEDLSRPTSEWQIGDFRELRTEFPLYAGAWHRNGISWFDANLLFTADAPSIHLATEVREYVLGARAGSRSTSAVWDYESGAEIAQFAARVWGQAEVWNLKSNSSLPADSTW
jgi:hypothetical protein